MKKHHIEFFVPALALLLSIFVISAVSCTEELHASELPPESVSSESEFSFCEPLSVEQSLIEQPTVDSSHEEQQEQTESDSTHTYSPDTETADTADETSINIETESAETQPAAPEPVPEKTVPSGKVAYLTFDDGPDKNNTEQILGILDDYGIKATFFVVGCRAKLFPEQLKAIRDGGHSIGCHTYSHDYSRTGTCDGISEEIAKWEATVSDILGEVPSRKLFRFPGGSPINDKNKVKEAVAALGYNGFDWDCVNNDCNLKKCPDGLSADEWLKQSFKETYKYGSSLKKAPLIVLMHETYSETVDMLSWAIEFLQNEGYTFDTLDNYDGSWYY